MQIVVSKKQSTSQQKKNPNDDKESLALKIVRPPTEPKTFGRVSFLLSSEIFILYRFVTVKVAPV